MMCATNANQKQTQEWVKITVAWHQKVIYLVFYSPVRNQVADLQKHQKKPNIFTAPSIHTKGANMAMSSSFCYIRLHIDASIQNG